MQRQQFALMNTAMIDAEAVVIRPHSFATFAHLLTTAAELSENPEGATCNGEHRQPSPGNRSGNGKRRSCQRHISQPDPSDN
jgi:hypothetical protein